MIRRFALPLLLLAFAGSALLGTRAIADGAASTIEVTNARSHPNLGVPVGVAYLSLENRGERDDRLLRVECARAAMTELHESLEQDGVMRMKHHPEGFAIPAGGRVDLEPGGKHVMLMQLEGSLAEGDSLALVLVFEHAGRLEISVPVVPRTP